MLGPIAPLLLGVALALPAPSVEGVPGWLALATVAPGTDVPSRRYGFLPDQATAAAAIVDGGWEAVAKGTELWVVSEAGVARATYARTSKEPYGCDGMKQEMALFAAAARLPQGPVWLLPLADAGGASAVAATEEKGQATSGARAFRAGELSFVLRKTGRMTGGWTLSRGATAIATGTFEKTLMEGAEDTPLDIAQDGEIGVPRPTVLFRKGDLQWLVLVSTSYEGFGLSVLRVRSDGAALIDAGYLYWCAF